MDSAYLSQLSNSDTAEENSAVPEKLVVPSNSRRRASMSEPINLTDISKDLYNKNVIKFFNFLSRFFEFLIYCFFPVK